MLKMSHHLSELKRCNISEVQYFRVMSPGVEWLTRCVGKNANKELFQSILAQYREHSNNSFILKHILDNFDASHYAHASLGMASLIKAADPSHLTLVDSYAAMGKALAAFPPPEDQRLPLLNEIWKVVAKCDNLVSYVTCCTYWLDCAKKHYSEREVLIILGDLASKLSSQASATGAMSSDIPEVVQRQLEVIVHSLITAPSTEDSTSLLTSESLMKILDTFNSLKKIEICKEVLEEFKKTQKTNDAILINSMFYICRVVHDSLDSLSQEGDRKYISALLCSFIEKIEFGRDLEQQLNVYVECRAIFSNLDQVKDRLILCVAGLAVKAYALMKGKHSRKTSAFAKACLAYCHITIPSIANAFRKLELLLHCAEVSLLNQCLPQTDTFLKAAISLIPELPTHTEVEGKRVHTEEKLVTTLQSMLSVLVVAPGHPEHGPFYIVQGLLTALPRYPWQSTTTAQTKLYVELLGLLCTYAQRKFPYAIPQVESNDELYGGSMDYMAELKQSIDTCVMEIMRQLTALGEKSDASAKLNQARLVLEFVNQVASRMEMNADVGDFVVRLLNLASKQKANYTRADTRYFTNTGLFVMKKSLGTSSESTIATACKALNV
jgi:hypothetical protein